MTHGKTPSPLLEDMDLVADLAQRVVNTFHEICEIDASRPAAPGRVERIAALLEASLEALAPVVDIPVRVPEQATGLSTGDGTRLLLEAEIDRLAALAVEAALRRTRGDALTIDPRRAFGCAAVTASGLLASARSTLAHRAPVYVDDAP